MTPATDVPEAAVRLPALDIVVVNWNAGDQLAACLGSIADAHQDGFRLSRVAVVDNASTDGSAEAAADAAAPVELLRNPDNLGFAVAANRGAAGSTADYLLFLNPDARLEPDTLTHCVAAMEGGDGLGVVGPQLVDAQGRVARSCARFPTAGRFWAMVFGLHRLLSRRAPGMLMTDWDHASTRDVDHVIGAAYLVRRVLFEELGGFDERFFLYLEDLDLSLRIHQAGRSVRYLATAHAFHSGGGVSRQVPVSRLVHALQSRVLYGYKHFRPATATALLLGTLLIEPPIRLFGGALRLSPREIGVSLGLAARLLLGLPALLRRIAWS